MVDDAPALSKHAERGALDALSLSETVRPFLISILELSELDESRRPSAERTHPQVQQTLLSTLARVEALGVSGADLAAVRYALVAFADEFMQLVPGRFQEYWARHRLQVEHFDETLAGIHFYDRLAELRTQSGARPLVLVYYLCLLLGFRGKYRGEDELSCENLLQELERDLEPKLGLLGGALSPHGKRPHEPATDRKRNRLLEWLALTAAGLSLFWYFGLFSVIDDAAAELRDKLAHHHDQLSD